MARRIERSGWRRYRRPSKAAGGGLVSWPGYHGVKARGVLAGVSAAAALERRQKYRTGAQSAAISGCGAS
jgi:hypothetical protein